MKQILPYHQCILKQKLFKGWATLMLLFISLFAFSQANTWGDLGATTVNNAYDINGAKSVIAERFGAVSFSIGNKGYFGTGRDERNDLIKNSYKDFWEYDPSTNVWTQKADFGGGTVFGAFGFSMDNQGYVGCGLVNPFVLPTLYPSLNIWGYSPSGNYWFDLPTLHLDNALPRTRAVGFSIGNKFYFGTGGWGIPAIPGLFGLSIKLVDFWEYDPSLDPDHRYRRVADFPGRRDAAVAFTINNKGYVGTGNSEATLSGGSDLSDFWEYDPSIGEKGTWINKDDFPGGRTSFATGFSMGNKGYVQSDKGFWEFDPMKPKNAQWEIRSLFPGPSNTMATGFSIGSRGYIGFGKTSREWWQYTPYPSIYNTSVSTNSTGVDSPLNVKFTAYGGFNPGNIFSVQLSNADGNFTSSPPVIGSAAITIGSNNTSGTINAIVPVNTAMGSHYRVRIASSDPVGLSDDNGTDINIYAVATPDKWIRMADFRGGARVIATGFSIGSKGYMGTGLSDGFKKDFWEFDPATNIWSQKADFGGGLRGAATGFNIGNLGYIGAGYIADVNGVEQQKNDFWQYDPSANNWTQKKSFGGEGRHFAVGFSIGNKGYMGTGGGKDDFWEFDGAIGDSGTWTKKAPYGGGPRWGSTGFSVAGKGYIGTGYNEKNISQNDFWEYDPLVDKWTKKADLTKSGRSFATGFSIGSKGYIGTGGEMDTKSGLNDFWEYEPSTDTWTQGINFGGPGRIWATGFSIGGKGYIGTSGEPGSDFWQYTPTQPGTWLQKADFRGGPRVIATGFSIGSKGYMGTGLSDGFKKDFWEFDPATNIWSQKADFGGGLRGAATGFNIGNLGYIGAGYIADVNGVEQQKNDFWQYNPSANNWTQKKSFGGEGRHFAVGFSIGNKGYMGTGGGKDDFWEFDPAISDSGTWTKKASYGGGPRWGSTGFSVAGKGYIGTGYNEKNISQNDFWEYDPLVDKWTKKADLTMSGRSFATGFSIGSKGYIGTGGELDTKSGLNDFWEYDPLTDSWTKRANFGGPGRIWATGFSIGSKGYIGTSGEPGSDFWEYSALSSPTITTSVAVNSLCAGSSFGVTYSSIGAYNAGNMFTAQLSDSTGSFTTSVNIGTVSSLVSGSIIATIPTNTLAGSAYRVRVISSDPVNTGSDNGSNLAINPIPVLTSILTPDAICNNTTFNYTPTSSPAGITFSWKRAALNGISNAADSSAPGNTKGIICEKLTNTTSSPVNVTYRYYLNNNGCTNTIPYSVVVPVKPSPLVKTRNVMVYLNADGTANITPEQVDNGSVSYCGNIIYALDKYSFGCADLGANMVTLTATDAAGNISSGTANVTVLDKLAPEITGACASPNTLWPPNKKMRKVEVNYNTTDNCSVKCVTLSVTSNEIQCGRDVDWVILDNHHLLLRAERQGNKKERIYTIVITAQDAAGNTSTQKLSVTVPRRQPNSWKEGTSEDAKIAGGEAEYSGLSVQAMPNPSQHYFTLITHAVNNEPITIRVTDVAGRVIEVKQNIAANGSVQIGQQYKSGTYYVELIQGDNKAMVTLLKKGD